MRGKLKRKFAVVMASVLALSNIQTAPVFAAVEEERTIIRFEELPEKYAVQELELGAAEEDIRFPGSLWADMVIVKQTNEGSKTEETEEKEVGKTEEGKAETEPSVEAEAGSGTDSIMEQQAGDADPSVSTEKEKALPGDGEKTLPADSSDDGTVSEPETTGSDTTGTVGPEKEEEPEIKQPESDAEENDSPDTGLESDKPAKEENDAGKPSGNLSEDSGNSEEQKTPVATGSEAEEPEKDHDSDDKVEKTVRRKIRDVEWELNFTESSDAEFQSEIPGTYVYEPVMPSGYEMDLEVELPQIFVMVGTFDEEENGTDYAYTTPSNATPANAEFRKVPASGNLSAAEEFALFISTFNHGGSGQLTTTISNDTVTVEGSVTGATNSLSYGYSGSPDLIIDWRADYEGKGSTGGLLEFHGSAIQFEMNGGEIIRSGSTDLGAYAFVFSDCQVSLNSGTVQGDMGIHILNGTLVVENGAVISSLKIALYSRWSCIEITGGTLSASGDLEDCIFLTDSSELTMTDGNISADGKRGCAIYAGENSVVDVQGGTISAAGPGGRAVDSYEASKITIINSDISLSGLWVNETEAVIDEDNYTAYVVLPDQTPFPTEASAITMIPKDANAIISPAIMLDDHTWLFTIESGCLIQSYQVKISKNPLKVDPTTIDFGSLAAGYETLPAPQTITIENSGKDYIYGFTVMGGANYEIIWVDSPIPQGESVTITVQPKTGLTEGVWRENLIISADGSVIANVEAVVEIKPASGRVSRDSSSESNTMDSSVLIGTWERIDSVFWKFRLTTGRYAENRWGIIDGRWYYFDHNGRMVTDWQQLNGVWYYLATSEDVKRTEEIKEGEMRTGWIYDLFYQKWFYLDKDGAMATGWREIDGKWYYFNPAPDGMRGAMVTDAWVDDWYLNQDGIGINQTRR